MPVMINLLRRMIGKKPKYKVLGWRDVGFFQGMTYKQWQWHIEKNRSLVKTLVHDGIIR